MRPLYDGDVADQTDGDANAAPTKASEAVNPKTHAPVAIDDALTAMGELDPADEKLLRAADQGSSALANEIQRQLPGEHGD